MKILIISEAWYPQVNGVVRTLEVTKRLLEKDGHKVEILSPAIGRWATFTTQQLFGIHLEFLAHARIAREFDHIKPDVIHIATEGPLGWAARRICLRRRLPFTTSYHTRFPEYLAARAPFGLAGAVKIITYAGMRRFHAPSSAVMVATQSMEQELRARKFHHLARWSRGVDTELFRPYGKDFAPYASLLRPILLYVGRVSVEKSVNRFLDLKTPGSKVVVGEGDDLARLRVYYPEVRFTGLVEGEDLARHYAAADLFVFPSTTDTFGLVLLEAAACGLRIASVPAPGPTDIFADEKARAFAVLDDDLGCAIEQALHLPGDPLIPRRYAEGFSWEACTRQFFDHLQASTPEAVKRITRLRTRL
jgi:glycosyltransferase involved in cell wall biosynthesis